MRQKTKTMLIVGGGVLGLGALAAIATSGGGDGGAERPKSGGGWADRSAPDRIREIAGPIEEATGWRGLVEFLTAVAWAESRGNQYACAGVKHSGPDTTCPGNNARGYTRRV